MNKLFFWKKRQERDWNHRILAHEYEVPRYNKKVHFYVHEVHYDNGKPDSYTLNPIVVSGETKGEIRRQIRRMNKCWKKSILWAGPKWPQEYNAEDVK